MFEPVQRDPVAVPLGDIFVGDRLRPVSEAGVASLLASIAELGVMKDPIHLRRKKAGRLVLMAGGHRLEAARRLGWDTIRAVVWTEVTDSWAQLLEIDDNLAGAEMNALDTAVFLAERKAIYERLHPETVAKTGSALVAQRWNTADIMSTVSFAQATAEKFGITDRHVRRMVAIGSRLTAEQVAMLREAQRKPTLTDLQHLAKIAEPDERAMVILRFASGNAPSIAKSRRSLAEENGEVKPSVKAVADIQVEVLLTAWGRASMAERREFVARAFDELSPLVVDEAEARDAAEVALLKSERAQA